MQGPLDHHIGVHELRHANTGADDIEDLFEEFAAHPLRVDARQRRLWQAEIACCIQDQVVHFRGGIFTILGIAPEGDALPQVGGVLQGDFLAVVVANFVQLDDEILEHERCFVRTDQSGSFVALIEGLEVLAQVGLGVTAADLLDFRTDVTEEVALHGFSQVPGRMLGNPFAGLGNGNQLCFAGRVFFLGRHFPGQLGIAMSQADNGLHGDETSFIEVELGGIRQPHLEGHLPLLDFLDHARKALRCRPWGSSGCRRHPAS